MTIYFRILWRVLKSVIAKTIRPRATYKAKRLLSYEDVLARWMKDPEFAAEYKALGKEKQE